MFKCIFIRAVQIEIEMHLIVFLTPIVHHVPISVERLTIPFSSEVYNAVFRRAIMAMADKNASIGFPEGLIEIYLIRKPRRHITLLV